MGSRSRIAPMLVGALLAGALAGTMPATTSANIKPSARSIQSSINAPHQTQCYAADGHLAIASWYGKHWRGRRTASGSRFDERQFTAASRTLPFGTVLRVTNLSTNLQTIVIITDRGPYVGSRSLDLSQAAAQEIGMERQGVGTVLVEELGNVR